MDAGSYGKSTGPAWWTGSKFLYNINNKVITHFQKMSFPDPPEDTQARAVAPVSMEQGKLVG